ncbi:MAG TPA: PilN domain-containing protein [Gammaproteobacteria bacterium]|nr:PilN domain-containing protein [Gammaproteobacteria bacterium]
MKQHINLLLEDEAIFLSAKRMGFLLAFFALMLSVLVTFIIAMLFLRFLELKNLEETYTKALNEVSLQPIKPDSKALQEYEGLKSKLAYVEGIQAVQSQTNKTKFSAIFRALAQSKVPKTWINQIRLSNREKSIILRGNTTNPQSLIEMLKLMQSQPGLQEKGITAFTLKRDKDPNAYSFKMQGHL